MRLLVVEDDKNYLGTLVEALTDIGGLEVLVAPSRDSAFARLDSTDFDLVICDLKLPTQDDALDEEIQHGLAVHGRCRDIAPGMPLLILSAFGTLDLVTPLLTDAPREDLFGTRQEIALTDFIQKGRLDQLVAKVKIFAQETARLADIEIVTESAALAGDPRARRTLRILARRHNGRLVRVRALGGGFSNATAVRLQILDGRPCPE